MSNIITLKQSLQVPEFKYPDDPATEYAHKVLANEIVAGPYVRQQCFRHCQDLINAEQKGWEYLPAKGERFCNFSETLIWPSKEGPIKFFLWQKFIGYSAFSWVHKETGYRRFQRILILTGKGSGKSPFGGIIALYLGIADNEQNAEVYVGANTANQAGIIFKDIKDFIINNDTLATWCSLRGGLIKPTGVFYPPTNSAIEKVSGDSKRNTGIGGFRTHGLIVDEFNEAKSDEFMENYSAGFKSRKNPMSVILMNAGSDLSSPGGISFNLGKRVLSKETVLDDFLPYMCAVDPDDNPWEDEKCWIKTEPSLPEIPGYTYIHNQIAITKGAPSKKARVGRLIFCIWSEGEESWIEPEVYDACVVNELPPSKERRPRPCFLALDLASNRDFTAGAIVWVMEDGSLCADTIIWTPKDTLRERAKSDNMPYDMWADQGYIIPTPGRVQDYEYPARWVEKMQKKFDVKLLAFDNWNCDDLIEKFDDLGVDLTYDPDKSALLVVPHPQGFFKAKSVMPKKYKDKEIKLTMPKSISVAETLLLNKRLKVKDNPATRSAVLGAKLKTDPALNRHFEKVKSTTRIDPAVSLVMAVGSAVAKRPKKTKLSYEEVRAFSSLAIQEPTEENE